MQFNHSDGTPQELLDLDGRNYVFKIMIKDPTKFNQSFTYRVISLTDVPDIIQSFSECASTLVSKQSENYLNLLKKFIQSLFLIIPFLFWL